MGAKDDDWNFDGLDQEQLKAKDKKKNTPLSDGPLNDNASKLRAKKQIEQLGHGIEDNIQELKLNKRSRKAIAIEQDQEDGVVYHNPYDIQGEPASVFKRLFAVIIDSIILNLGLIAFMLGGVIEDVLTIEKLMELQKNPHSIDPKILSSISLVQMGLFFIFVILPTATVGKTIGKQIMSIRVVNIESLQRPGFINAILRETIGKVLSTLFVGIGFLMAFFNKKKRGLHDFVARTMVIKDN